MAEPIVDIQSHVEGLFQQTFGHPCMAVARAPGRVNLLGEHVDYNDGWVLPAAIDRATYVAFSPADANGCTLLAADYKERTAFSIEHLAATNQRQNAPVSGWARYPAGVAWALRENGLRVRGLNAVFASEVPRGAGLSSSASVELAFAIAWMTLGEWRISPIELAVHCQRAENEYVGVNCGIMDQVTSACGEVDRVLFLDCRSLEYQTYPLPAGVSIIIADTGVRHSLTSSAYNDRRAACEDALGLLKQDLPGITALRDVSLADFNRLAAKLPLETEKRARHVVAEIDRTQRAVHFLNAHQIAAFGRLMNECHASLRDLYEVSCPELDVMAHTAQSLDGCYGARLTGAGFGGCTVNLVAQDQADNFAQKLAAGYKFATGLAPEIHVCRASAGASLA